STRSYSSHCSWSRASKPSPLSLRVFFKSLGPANCTLHAAPLRSTDELRNVMFYSSKLLKQPPRSLRNIDLYTMLPKPKSEPLYVKAKWERELEAAQKEARSWVGPRARLY